METIAPTPHPLPTTQPETVPLSLANPLALQAILQQADAELVQLDPQVEALEAQLGTIQAQLSELKQNKRKLVTLRLSLQALLANDLPETPPTSEFANSAVKQAVSLTDRATVTAAVVTGNHHHQQSFLPEKAFAQADTILKQKQSLNYELFRAIVFNGGIANTEQIKEYLITQGIQQPNSGGSFASVDRSEISARVGYLIRKGLVEAMGKGHFIAKLGWEEET
jgi:hypothetical protein